MKTVLIAGAGKSSSALIDYMLNNAKNKWHVIVMDADIDLIHEKLHGHPKGSAAVVDIHNIEERQSYVRQADIVISLMPHDLHILLAKDCLLFNKNLITASYVSDEMLALSEEAREKGLLFMCEMGLDPGIDHMSAMSLLEGIHRIGGVLTSFKSFCGGLIAPESDDNPWHYKLSWNPKNVVLAGKNGAHWLENGKENTIEYHQIFESVKRTNIEGIGSLCAYMNRDSYKYLSLYQLEDVKTFYRATLRYPSFIKGWNCIVKAGLTAEDDNFDADETTYADWIAAKSGLKNNDDLKNEFAKKYHIDAKELKILDWLRIFENRQINARGNHSSAQILQMLLEERWKMRINDKDMVIMQHQIEYERKGTKHRLNTTMIVKGEDRQNSAMAKTVGIPMGILAKRILNGSLDPTQIAGVQIPVMPYVFTPILKELQKYGIEFVEDIS